MVNKFYAKKKSKANQKAKILRNNKKHVLIKPEHRFLLKAISDGIRSGKTQEEVMLELGYSVSYAKNPNHLKETDSWVALMEEQIPDAELLKVHRGLLHHKSWMARDHALDKGYKLKSRYDNTITLKGKLSGLSDEEVEGRIAGLLSGIVGALTGEGQKGNK